MSRNSIRILIADDHYVVRMGLSALVETELDLQVVGEASNGDQVVDLYKKLEPDLVLMDLRMPRSDGIFATRVIREQFPKARILMLTTYDGDDDIHKALSAGASGYLLKNSTRESLIPAIRAVAAGKQWIPQEVASRLAARKMFEELTPRELEVLNKLAKGLANKEIADALNISEHTVKGYLKTILGKLHVADRTEAVTAALQRGIIHLT
jgi:DNA-binding NarL/FixJ family response regulator